MKEYRLNVQGLARREPLLLGTMIADPGCTFVSIDLSAGEPTATTHFSGDPAYRYCTYDGIGKAPFYKDGWLWIDDIYLAMASISPIHKAEMRAAFDRKWPAGSFSDQWLADPEVVKGTLKKLRQFNKMAQLGFGYGLGPKKFVKQSYEAGYNITFADAKALHRTYWHWVSGVKRFVDRCSRQVEKDGYIVNSFGYRGVPEPHKAFNFFIQSTVSGIIHVLLAHVERVAPYADLVTIIHDEAIFSVPDEALPQFRIDMKEATRLLNDSLKWSVAIRTGFAPGKSLYEAK